VDLAGEAGGRPLVLEVELPGDPPDVLGLVGHHERDADSGRAGAARAPDAVHVVLAGGGRVEVHHVGDAGDVYPAGGHVGGHERVDRAGLEAGQRLLALGLRAVAVHGDGRVPRAPQALDQAVGAPLGAHEDQRTAALAVGEDLDEGVELGLVGHAHEAVLDVAAALRGRVVGDPVGALPGVGPGDAARLALQRGRQDDRLALGADLADDPVDGRAEPHVEHAVGLVEDERGDVAQRHVAAVDQVLQAAGCGDEDVGAGGGAGLLVDSGAAVDGRDRERPGVRGLAQLLDDLGGQLARRREDQRRRAARLGGGALDQRQAEGQRLARSRGRADEDVVAGQGGLEHEPLDGEGGGDAAPAQRGGDRA